MATRRLSEDGVLVRTRTRAPFLLPSFDGDTPLTTESTQFDRLELVREYVLDGLDWDYDRPIELAHEIGRDGHCAALRLPLDDRCDALRVEHDGGGEGSVKVSLGQMASGARWIIEFSLEFRALRRGPYGGDDAAMRPPVRLRARVTMSPTRLAAHTRMRGVDLAVADWRQVLTSDAVTHRTIADSSVSMTHDNLMPTRFLQPVSLARSIAETTRCIAAVEALIEHLVGVGIRERRPTDGPWLREGQPWTIKQAETYWEFGHVHAIEYVRRLRPTLWAIGKDANERSWTLGDGEETIAFTSRLTDSVRLAIYPKTVDRVRFEVRHMKSIPGNNSQSIAMRLAGIAEDATSRANRARQAIVERAQARHAATPADSLDALCDLTMLLQNMYPNDPARAADILRLLLTRGALRCRGDEFPVSVQEAQNLKARGVVGSSRLSRHSSRDVLYPLAPRYQPLFELFSGLTEDGSRVGAEGE